MHIIFFSQRYLPASGGAEHHLAEICRHLVNKGHQVTVITSDALYFEGFWSRGMPAISPAEEVIEGVRVNRFPVIHLPGSPLTYHALRRLIWLGSCGKMPASLLKKIAQYTPRVPKIWDWVNKCQGDYDLIAGMNIAYENFINAGQYLAKKLEIPFVCFPLTHLGAGSAPGQDKISQFYTLRHQVDLVTSSDLIVAQTQSEQDFYANHGLPRQQIPIVGPGVWPEKILAQPELVADQLPIIFCISTLSFDKGITHLIEAVQQLWQNGRMVNLLLAGQVTQPFQAYFDELPAFTRNQVQLLGKISETEKRDLLAVGDIFALPSRTDSFGMAYLEAWLYGKPVVAANTWGVNDLIMDGVDGLLLPFADVPALTAALTDLLDHPQKAAALGQAGREKVYKQYQWPEKLEKIESLFRRLEIGD